MKKSTAGNSSARHVPSPLSVGMTRQSRGSSRTLRVAIACPGYCRSATCLGANAIISLKCAEAWTNAARGPLCGKSSQLRTPLHRRCAGHGDLPVLMPGGAGDTDSADDLAVAHDGNAAVRNAGPEGQDPQADPA